MRDSLAMILRCIKRAYRNPDTYITAVVLPLMLYVLFTAVLGGAFVQGAQRADHILPGILLTGIGYCAAATGALVYQDASGGFIDRFLSMPVARHAFLAGHAAASLLKNAVAVACILLAATAAGGAPHPTPAGACVAAVLLFGYALFVTCASAVFGLVAKSAEGAGAFSFTVLFLPYLSSGFVSTETMARPLRTFAHRQPLTPIADSVRAALSGAPNPRLGEALLWLIACTALFGILAARLVTRRRV